MGEINSKAQQICSQVWESKGKLSLSKITFPVEMTSQTSFVL